MVKAVGMKTWRDVQPAVRTGGTRFAAGSVPTSSRIRSEEGGRDTKHSNKNAFLATVEAMKH
ncbi:hypothetical protein SP21_32 [Salmonella phage 21]|nr:hypothetical protein SP21_32 [Salmonella phage 21]